MIPFISCQVMKKVSPKTLSAVFYFKTPLDLFAVDVVLPIYLYAHKHTVHVITLQQLYFATIVPNNQIQKANF